MADLEALILEDIDRRAGVVQLVKLSEVKGSLPEPVIPGYLYNGWITVIAGLPGIGKSSLALTWASAMTVGYGYHCGYEHEPGSVLYVGSEETAQTIASGFSGNPELFTWMGPIRRLNGIREWESPVLLYNDYLRIEEALGKLDMPKLIIVDPIGDAIPDKNKSDNVYKAVSSITETARKFGCGVIFISHLNKSVGIGALNRISGAMEIIGKAAVVLMVGKDRTHKQVRHCVPAKVKFTAEAGLEFSFMIEGRKAVWHEGGEIPEADDLIEPNKYEEARRDPTTRDWIVELLEAEGGCLQKWKVEKEAKEAGISWDTVDRTASRMVRRGEMSREREKTMDGKITYWWKLGCEGAD